MFQNRIKIVAIVLMINFKQVWDPAPLKVFKLNYLAPTTDTNTKH